MPHANETVIRDLYAAFASGEMAIVDGLLAEDVTWHDRRAVVLQLTRAERNGRAALHDREVIVYELRDGRIIEVWEHPGDLHAIDAFFA